MLELAPNWFRFAQNRKNEGLFKIVFRQPKCTETFLISPRFVLFGANLNQLGSDPDIPARKSPVLVCARSSTVKSFLHCTPCWSENISTIMVMARWLRVTWFSASAVFTSFTVSLSSELLEVWSDGGVRLAPKETNPGLFQIRFQCIWRPRAKCTEI